MHIKLNDDDHDDDVITKKHLFRNMCVFHFDSGQYNNNKKLQKCDSFRKSCLDIIN